MAELQRFKGFQLDAGAQFIKLYFPLDIDKNGIQNAAETGLAICEFLKDIENCKFYAVLRTGSFELNFTRDYGLQYPIIEIKEIDVEEKPRQPVFNDLIIDKPSYQKLLGLYDLEHIKENFYHFNKDNSEG